MSLENKLAKNYRKECIAYIKTLENYTNDNKKKSIQKLVFDKRNNEITSKKKKNQHFVSRTSLCKKNYEENIKECYSVCKHQQTSKKNYLPSCNISKEKP